MATGDKLIQVKDLKKYYNRGAIKALDGVTVDIDRGDVMVVIGPSGSGKSTFLRSLNLLEGVNRAIAAAKEDGSFDQYVLTANELASGDIIEGLVDENGEAVQ